MIFPIGVKVTPNRRAINRNNPDSLFVDISKGKFRRRHSQNSLQSHRKQIKFNLINDNDLNCLIIFEQE